MKKSIDNASDLFFQKCIIELLGICDMLDVRLTNHEEFSKNSWFEEKSID